MKKTTAAATAGYAAIADEHQPAGCGSKIQRLVVELPSVLLVILLPSASPTKSKPRPRAQQDHPDRQPRSSKRRSTAARRRRRRSTSGPPGVVRSRPDARGHVGAISSKAEDPSDLPSIIAIVSKRRRQRRPGEDLWNYASARCRTRLVSKRWATPIRLHRGFLTPSIGGHT